jgi:stage II sporulation protein D
MLSGRRKRVLAKSRKLSRESLFACSEHMNEVVITMKHICCSFGLLVLCSALSAQTLTVAPAGTTPVCSPQLARVRFMPEEPVIKVLLTKGQEGLMVEVKGPHNIYDPYSGKKLDAAFTGSSYYMSPTSDGIRWGQDFPGTYQVLIIPDEPSSGVFVNGIAYPGVVSFYEVDSRLAAVNWASLEDFVSSVFSGNFLPKETDQREALAAYAIALRTKAFQHIQSGENAFWDVAADACGYKGNAVVRFDAPFREAMKSTRKLVMVGKEQAATSQRFDKKSIDDIRQQMPVADVQSMAREGRDARIILHRFYPDQNLSLVDQRNETATALHLGL